LALSPRCALQRAVDAWHAVGFDPQLAFELEFYVMRPDPMAVAGWAAIDVPGHRVYGVGPGCDTSGVMFDIFDAAERADLDLEGMSGEFHPGQLELNLGYGRAMDAADRAFIAREMTRDVAAARGFRATYMGRPFSDKVGNGLHVNLSLVPLAGGPNAFHDPSTEFGLSTVARQCLGGLIHHHEGLAALSAPLVNSYKRLVPGIIAGYWANWGLDNRFATYRVPHDRGPATRIENRMVCGSADPYLASAAMLNAALIGVAEGIDCGPPQLGDADAQPITERHTPHTLAEALDALAADTVLCEALGADLVRAFLTLRHDELAKWKATEIAWDVESVSDWELQRYLPYY
jgi:glutamine synthetase